MTARLSVVTAVMIALAAWTNARPQAAAGVSPDVAAAVPLVFGSWIGRDAPPLDPAIARVLAADQYVHRYYGIAGRGSEIADVEFDIAYYARPQAGAAMHSPLACLPGNGWQVVESGRSQLAVQEGTAHVRQLVVRRGEDRLAMTYWFQNRGAVIGNEYAQRLQLLRNGLTGRPTNAALVRVMARDTADGRVALGRFTRDVAALLVAVF
jgi:EpsI family protein